MAVVRLIYSSFECCIKNNNIILSFFILCAGFDKGPNLLTMENLKTNKEKHQLSMTNDCTVIKHSLYLEPLNVIFRLHWPLLF